MNKLTVLLKLRRLQYWGYVTALSALDKTIIHRNKPREQAFVDEVFTNIV